MSRFRFLVSLVACSAAVTLLACSGQRPAPGVVDLQTSYEGFPLEAWEVAVVVNLMNTDEPGPRIGSNQWDTLLASVLAARIR